MEEVVEEAMVLLGKVLLADTALDDVLVKETAARGLKVARRELHEDARRRVIGLGAGPRDHRVTLEPLAELLVRARTRDGRICD